MDAFDSRRYEPLRIALSAAVPLWIAQIQREQWGWDEIERVAREAAQVVAEKGDIIMFRSPKKGETAKAFNSLARGLACMSFAPRGVRFSGMHFEAHLPEEQP